MYSAGNGKLAGAPKKKKMTALLKSVRIKLL
jgi:hypothetical protein